MQIFPQLFFYAKNRLATGSDEQAGPTDWQLPLQNAEFCQHLSH